MESSVKLAATRINPYIINTPVQRSNYFSAATSANIFLKCENLQHTGSFKVRGAFNALLEMKSKNQFTGVMAASTGNHGAATAYASLQLGLKCTIFVPHGASAKKIEKIRDMGAEIRFWGNDALESEHEARRVSIDKGVPYISPYNDFNVIAGQGTIGLELLQQLPQLDIVLASVGGGGLISGIASYCKSIRSNIEIIGCSPEHSPVMHKSVQAGHLLEESGEETLSDGTAGGVEENSVTFPICQKLVDDWLTVSEEEIAATMHTVYNQEKMIIEGAAAVAMAGIGHIQNKLAGKTVAIVICGGNIDDTTVTKVFRGMK